VIEEELPQTELVEPELPPDDGAVTSGDDGFWYYCASARGYYPEVPDCPEAWVKVAPRSSSTDPSEDVR
jgi:hypothetical protein